MYLSRLILNLRSRQVRAELANPYEMHRTIMKGFPDGIRDTDRVLYRLETRPQQPYLTVLVQSRSLPDFQSLHETGYLCQPAETKSFDLRLEVGQAYTFRLVANPTRKIQDPNNENGKRVGIYKEEEQLGWLQRKAIQHGFLLKAVRIKPGSRLEGVLRRDDQKHDLKLLVVQFDGVLVVTDAQKLQQAVTDGIGSAKGFGCGLLSLARTA